MEAASSTSSSGYAVFQPTPSQNQADLLSNDSAITNTLLEMGFWYHQRELPGRALLHVDEALLLAYVAVAVARGAYTEAGEILNLDKDHQAPYTIRAWATADRPATHVEIDATRAAGLHEARIWMRRQPDARPPAAEERGVTAQNRPRMVLASCPVAAREHAVSQLQEALAYCESFSFEVCHGCSQYELLWPACRGEYCMGCLLAWFCEHP